MKDSLRYGYNRASGAFGTSLLGRLAAAIVGLGALGIAIFLGAIFLAAVVGLMLIAGIVISIRVWWLKRKMEQYAREHGDLEADYVEVHQTDHLEIRQIDAGTRDNHGRG